jgi:hypothetical protein
VGVGRGIGLVGVAGWLVAEHGWGGVGTHPTSPADPRSACEPASWC